MHALEAIAQSANASDVKAEKVHSFKTGLIHSIAAGLFAAFGATDTSGKTRCIIEAAQKGLTPEEFNQALKDAQAMAKAADSAAGWNPQDKKGRKAYGPKESTFASQASEKRQVFGVAKLSITTLVHIAPNGVYDPQMAPAWQQALQQAREYLKANKLSWDGQPEDDQRKRREHNAEVKATNAAMDQARAENPQEQGESLSEYMVRIAKATEENLELARQKTYMEQVDKLAAKLIKDHGLEMAVDIAEKVYAALSEVEHMEESKGDISKA